MNMSTARLKAIIALCLYQGLRIIEITRLDVSDLELLTKRALIKGKGRDDKEPIYLHPETVTHLETYLKVSGLASGPLFPSRSNRTLNRPMSTRGLVNLITEMFRVLAINKTAHGFRHYFTTQLLRNYEGNLMEVARYTRHRSLEMLSVYNDDLSREGNLPKYYEAFSDTQF